MVDLDADVVRLGERRARDVASMASCTPAMDPAPYLRDRRRFDNKADLHALMALVRELNTTLCSPGFTLVVAGMNNGNAARIFLDACPQASLHGFEVQNTLFKRLSRQFLHQPSYPNAKLFRLGLGNETGRTFAVSMPGNAREGAGLSVEGWRGIGHPISQANTTTLSAHATEHELATVHYALIDVEGFEPLVLQGMALHTERGRRRFPTFQWEAVYDAWVDSRHPRGAPSLEAQLRTLDGYDYESYAIGISHACGIPRRGMAAMEDRACNATALYLRVDPAFPFGRRPSFEGNVLSVHRAYYDPTLRHWVRQHAHASVGDC